MLVWKTSTNLSLEEDIESCLTAVGRANIDDSCYESERYGLCYAFMAASEWGGGEDIS